MKAKKIAALYFSSAYIVLSNESIKLTVDII